MSILELRGVGKTFRGKHRETRALEGIDLSIEEGEIFGIIGMSGAGKSTLVRCINLLEEPSEGDVYFDGKNLRELSEKELRHERQRISMIFQQFNLLMQRTALKNVCFPLELQSVSRAEAEARAKQLLNLVALDDKAESYPSQLSGGQRQRVAIARALASEPKILLCDEATSALDPKTTGDILELLADINRRLGLTIIVITHEMRVIRKICGRVAVLDEGRIAEFGETADVFEKPKSLAAKRLIDPDAAGFFEEGGAYI